MKKKFLTIILVSVVALSVIACENNSEGTIPSTNEITKKDDTTIETESVTATDNEPITETESKSTPIADEVEVYNGNDVLIVLNSITPLGNSYVAQFTVNNNSDTDYSISAHTYAINGIMMGDSLYSSDVDVPSGKKGKLSIELNEDLIALANIEVISELDVIFWGYSDYTKEWDSGLVNIQTNLYNEEYRVYVEDEPIYSDDCVDVYFLAAEANYIYCAIFNKTSYNASYTVENCSVNDWAYNITDYTYDVYDVPIHTNTYSIFIVPIDEDFIYEYDLTELTSFEFDISLRDSYWNYEGDLWEHTTSKIIISE